MHRSPAVFQLERWGYVLIIPQLRIAPFWILEPSMKVYGFCLLGNDGTKTSRRSPIISSSESGCPMEVWLAPGVAFVLGWTLRPLVETREVKLTPCNCQCVCECISKEQSSGLQVTLLFLVIGLGIVTGILILRQRETASVTLDSPSKGKKGFAGTKGQVLTLTS